MLIDTLRQLHDIDVYAGEIDYDHVHHNSRLYVFDFSLMADVELGRPPRRRGRLHFLGDPMLEYLCRRLAQAQTAQLACWRNCTVVCAFRNQTSV